LLGEVKSEELVFLGVGDNVQQFDLIANRDANARGFHLLNS